MQRRPRIPSELWDELARLGDDVGVKNPREVIGYLLKKHRAPEAEHSFKFGDESIFRAIWPNDSPIVIRGKARVGKTRTAQAFIEKIKSENPILVIDPQHEYNGNPIKLEGLLTIFEKAPNGLYTLRLNKNNPDMSRLELINALRIIFQKFGVLSRWVFVFEEISSRFSDLPELHSFFSEAAKFTRKTVGVEITGTVLDDICKVIEIKGG